MQRNKKIYLLMAAASSVGLGALSAQANPTVDLSITASGGTWEAFISDATPTQDDGLAFYDIDVDASGGTMAVTGASGSPAPEGSFLSGPKVVSGFSGSNDFDGTIIGGNDSQTSYYQNFAYSGANNATKDTAVLLGVSQAAGVSQGATWASPAEIASGTYTGTGTLTVLLSATSGAKILSLLPSWTGPGNTVTDVVVSGSVTVGPVSSTHPIISLTSNGSTPTNYGTQITNGTGAQQGTFSNNPANNKKTVVGSGGSYIFAQVTGITSGTGTHTGYVEATGFNPATNTEVYGLDVTGISSALLTTLAGDINSSSSDGYGSGSTIAFTSLAVDPFPSNYNLFLVFTGAEVPSGDNYLGIDLTQDPNAGISSGALTTAVAVVPEPMSMGLLALGGVGMLARRRRREPSA